MNRPNAARGMRTASAPSALNRFRVSSDARMPASSWSSRASTASGVPVGASTPHQLLASYPGRPLSSMVGRSGITSLRLRPLSANGFNSPSRTNGRLCSRVDKVICACPVETSIIAGLPPL